MKGLYRGVIIICILCALAYAVAAQTEEGKNGEEKYLTRGEAAKLLSATDFLKQKIGELLSWSVGYDISAVSRARLVPSIKYIKVTPVKVLPDGRTVLMIMVAVDDPGGPSSISGVRADLTGIGQPANMALVDNGLWGDVKAGDNVYTIQTNVKPTVDNGEKDIPIAVANTKGWLAISRTSLDVERDPVVIWTRATPQSIAPGEDVVLEAAIDNPGRIEDVTSVVVDLTDIGGEKAVRMVNNGRDGDKVARDNVFSLLVKVAASASGGDKKLPVSVENISGGKGEGEITLTVAGK